MIRFVAKAKDGRQIIGLGLSEENLKRLREDKPIFIKGETVGLPNIDVVVFWGESEYTMTEKLAPMISAETVVRHGLETDELPPHEIHTRHVCYNCGYQQRPKWYCCPCKVCVERQKKRG